MYLEYRGTRFGDHIAAFQHIRLRGRFTAASVL
jgi:hypothetical protein